jgi:hypothetical protein
MNTVEKLTSTLSRPQVLREVGSGDRLLAAIGRWRHKGACVDLSDTDIVQLVFNVSGGLPAPTQRGVGASLQH